MKLIKLSFCMIVLTVCILFGTVAVGASTFSDVDTGTKQSEAISAMQEKGYINGFPDGTFRPDATLTRAEFVTIINKMYMYYVEAENIFTDVKSDDWFSHDVLAAVQAGYIKGMGDGRFAPNEAVTREQVCVMLNSILQLGDMYYTPTISDKVSDWAKDSVLKMVAAYVFTLEDDGRFRATQPITRAEACMALEKCIVEVDFEDVFEPLNLENMAQEELKNRISEIIQVMEDVVIPQYTDADAILVGNMIVESMKKYLADTTYDYVPDANAAYEVYRKLGYERAKLFKLPIYDNIDINNLAILFDFFYTPELNVPKK